MNIRIKFKGSESVNFFPEVKKRVDAYLNTHKIKAKGGLKMFAKSAWILTLNACLYTLLLNQGNTFPKALFLYLLLTLPFIMLLGNIAHDAIHNAYSPFSAINKSLAFVLDLVGFSSHVWRKNHSIHHTYTNIQQVDNDISNFPLFRYTNEDKHFKHHRYQHLFAPFVYAWVIPAHLLFLDFYDFYLLKKRGESILKPLIMACLFRGVHLAIFLGIPIQKLPIAPWQVGVCYLCFMAVSSFMAAMILSLAHLNDQVSIIYTEGKEQIIPKHWAIHELETTSNFGTRNLFLNTIMGGLNFQVEHHLFPEICHLNYPKIAPIVEQTAREFGIPYHCFSSFTEGVQSHFRLLKKYAQEPLVEKIEAQF